MPQRNDKKVDRIAGRKKRGLSEKTQLCLLFLFLVDSRKIHCLDASSSSTMKAFALDFRLLENKETGRANESFNKEWKDATSAVYSKALFLFELN